MTFKNLVQKSGKTRQELIEAMGCSQGYFSLLENGRRSVGPLYLGAAAAALGVSRAELRPDLAMLVSESSDQEKGAA